MDSYGLTPCQLAALAHGVNAPAGDGPCHDDLFDPGFMRNAASRMRDGGYHGPTGTHYARALVQQAPGHGPAPHRDAFSGGMLKNALARMRDAVRLPFTASHFRRLHSRQSSVIAGRP